MVVYEKQEILVSSAVDDWMGNDVGGEWWQQKRDINCR